MATIQSSQMEEKGTANLRWEDYRPVVSPMRYPNVFGYEYAWKFECLSIRRHYKLYEQELCWPKCNLQHDLNVHQARYAIGRM